MAKRKEVYYHCSKYYMPWDRRVYSYRRFVPASWDEAVWDLGLALLVDNSWIEEQLAIEEKESAAFV